MDVNGKILITENCFKIMNLQKKWKTNEKHNKINKQRTQKTKINEQSGLSSKLDPLTTCTGRENPEAFQGEN